MSSELEISGIRVAVGDCSVTERRLWHPPYQTGKTVHVHAKHYKHNEDGRTAPGVCGNGSVPLSHSGERRYENWNTHTHTLSTKQFLINSTEGPCYNNTVCYQRFCCFIEIAVIKKLDMNLAKAWIMDTF